MAFEGLPVMLIADTGGSGFQGIPVKIVNGSALNSAVWGNITGTLSDQTDLQSALNALLSPSEVVGDAPVSASNQTGVVHVALTAGNDGEAIVTLNGTPTWGNQTANSVGAIASTEKGSANGVATLGANGTVTATQLPAPAAGNTAGRPANPPTGTIYFDTSLSPSKPVWWNGASWVDATGATA